MSHSGITKIGAICGILSQIVIITALSISVFSSPWFSWQDNYLSVLGIQGSASRIFNSGLIASGLLSMVFTFSLHFTQSGSNIMDFLLFIIFSLTAVSFSALGSFPRYIILPHNLASITFFSTATAGLFLLGIQNLYQSHYLWALFGINGALLTLIFQVAPIEWADSAFGQLLSCIPWSLYNLSFGLTTLLKHPAS